MPPLINPVFVLLACALLGTIRPSIEGQTAPPRKQKAWAEVEETLQALVAEREIPGAGRNEA
jgi:hypothetical protein